MASRKCLQKVVIRSCCALVVLFNIASIILIQRQKEIN